MTVKLAITGKGGSGKTTIVKAFMHLFQEMFPEKSILLFDNDLTSELGHSFGLDIRFLRECQNKNTSNGQWKIFLFQ